MMAVTCSTCAWARLVERGPDASTIAVASHLATPEGAGHTMTWGLAEDAPRTVGAPLTAGERAVGAAYVRGVEQGRKETRELVAQALSLEALR